MQDIYRYNAVIHYLNGIECKGTQGRGDKGKIFVLINEPRIQLSEISGQLPLTEKHNVKAFSPSKLKYMKRV